MFLNIVLLNYMLNKRTKHDVKFTRIFKMLNSKKKVKWKKAIIMSGIILTFLIVTIFIVWSIAIVKKDLL